MAKKGFMDGYKTYDTSNGFGNSDKWKENFETRMNFKILTHNEIEDNKDVLKHLYTCITSKELKKEYYKLMIKFHPDKAGDTEYNKTISQLINETYFKLKNKFG